MDSYGLTLYGNLITEKLETLPDWNVKYFGRFIYAKDTKQYWLGGAEYIDGIYGWIPLGRGGNSPKINYSELNWDVNMSGDSESISSRSIPTLQGDSIVNLQSHLDRLHIFLENIRTGEDLSSKSIKSHHLDTTSGFKITSASLPILNDEGYFTNNILTIEDALNYLISLRADSIRLPEDSALGQNLNLDISSVYGVLLDYENYLYNLEASQIKVDYPNFDQRTTLQFAIEALVESFNSITFRSLIDTPADLGQAGQILFTDGNSLTYWAAITASSILAKYPDASESNVQEILTSAYSKVLELETTVNDALSSLDASQITTDSIADFNRVDEMLDWLFTNCFSDLRLPTSTTIINSGIGDTTNVYEALMYLRDRIEQVAGLVECNVDPENVSYTSVEGHSNLKEALDYIFTKI